MDQLMKSWKTINRKDFLQTMLVFQTLVTMRRHSTTPWGQMEEEVFDKMERLLQHPSFQVIINHAQMYPTKDDTKVMECMIFADYKKTGSGTMTSICESDHELDEEDLPDNDEEETEKDEPESSK